MMGYLKRVMWRGEGAVAVKHPKEELGVVADKEPVRYEVFRGGSELEGSGGGSEAERLDDDNKIETLKKGEEQGNKGELKCRIWVGERMVVEVGAGVSTIEVETRAAEEAVGVLKRESIQ